MSSEQLSKSYLILEDNNFYTGLSPSWQKKSYYGEVVFTTGMTGYIESLTDPSYAGQILTFTYPLIGNYGVPVQEDWESLKIYAAGVVVSEACINWSHQSGLHSFTEWLKKQNVPLIAGVDTRALTKQLRSKGTMLGVITSDNSGKHRYLDPHKDHLVSQVSISEKLSIGNGKKKVIAIDCGMKENIVRSLKKLPITLQRVPYNYDFTQDDYDGVFISNGPGDPTQCPETIEILQKAMKKNKPMFGICLGTQLMALAAGAKTFKLPFGHRGQNQPCIDVETEKCYITSQNHGYAVDAETLPKSWKVLFKNLNDHSVEGIAHKTKPYFAVQFHPEAKPGPTDTMWLFEKFYQTL